MLPVVMAASLILTVTPLNIFDVPVWDQGARLVRVLEQNDMIQDGKVVAKEDIPIEDKIKITSSYQYIYSQRDQSKLLEIFQITEGDTFATIFGFEREYENQREPSGMTEDTTIIYGNYYYEYDMLDIAGYSKWHNISSKEYGIGNPVVFERDGKHIEYDLTKEIGLLYEQHGEYANVAMEWVIEGNKLILTHVAFEVDEDGQTRIGWYGGYFFEK